MSTGGVDWTQWPPPTLQATMAVAIAVGTLYCYLGHRTLKFVIALTGFVLAGAVAAVLAAWLSHGNALIAAIGALVGGIAGLFALLFLYKVGVFAMGLLGAAVIAHNFLAARPEPFIPWVVLGIGCVGGLVAVALERPVMILATAALGAWMLVCGIAFFIVGPAILGAAQQPAEINDDHAVMIACWGVLTLAGVLAQFATRKRAIPKTA